MLLKLNNWDTNKIVTINSVLLGLFLSISMITRIITQFVVFENNIVMVIGLLLMFFFIVNKHIPITVPFVLINGMVILVMMLSLLLNENAVNFTVKYLLSFLLFGSVGMLLYSVKVEYKTILLTISAVSVCFSFITLFRYIPEAVETYYLEYSMEISYIMLIGMSAGIILWKYLNNVLKIAVIFITVISAYYLLFLSTCRGAVLALMFLVVAKYLSKIKYKYLWTALIVILGIVFFIGQNYIIDVLIQSDSGLRWITRFRSNQDITSGRNDLFVNAWNLINDYFLLGTGIGYFESIESGLYVHNLFLQFGVEFGAIFGSIFSFCVVTLIIGSLNKKDEFDLFLICQFIPRLLLSSVYWINPFFWIFLYKQILSKFKISRRIQ